MTTARSAFRCLLGDQEIALDAFDGQQTLLDFLRLNQGLTGTKEGCAEGDCGACTVLLGRSENNQLHYQPVNACIIPLGTVDSTQVLTVEHLADPQPHPVQLEMAKAHGSQCGFCTPGIVMSLAALHYACDTDDFTVDHEGLNDALAGNLCRCTGYGPIITAAQQALAQPIPDHCRSLQALGIQTLGKWASDDTYLHTKSVASIFAAPTSLADLTELMRALPQAQLIAGATDVGLWITKQHQRFDSIIYLGQVAELKRIHRTNQEVQIGAAVTLARSLDTLEDLAPDLGTLLHRFGSRQVRAQATLGGNIANGSPIGDLAPALIALGATLHLVGPDGERTMALEDFFIDYGNQDLATGEIIRMIAVPTHGHEYFHCWKVSKRFDQDISAVCGAFNLQLDNGMITSARIAFGGMAGTVQRARQCESALVGKHADCSALDPGAKALQQDFAPITDARASASYRVHTARGLLERYLRTISGKAPDLLYPASATPFCLPMAEVLNQGPGAALAHDSALKHATGEALYIDDIPVAQNTLHLAVGSASTVCGRIESMDLGAVRSAPGVIDVFCANDIPGQNDVSPSGRGDEPVLADTDVRFDGEPVFAVVATSHHAARAAAVLGKVRIASETPILTVDDALHHQRFISDEQLMQRGDWENAMRVAPCTASGTLYCGGQDHFYLEGQVSLAIPQEDGDMLVHCSTQHPSEIQQHLAKVLGKPANAITVEVRRMGGAFGGKESQACQWAALAAVAAQRNACPVKCRLDRDDDMRMTGKRHDFRIDWKVGHDADGRILAVDTTLASRCGCALDLSDPVNDRAMFHVDNAYFFPTVRIRSQRCFTNTVSNTAFRGFGGPQGMLAGERMIEAVARATGQDPLTVRKRNFYGAGERSLTPYHMPVDDFILDELVTDLEASSHYWQRREVIRDANANDPQVLRGLALTPVKFGISFTATWFNQAGALLHIYRDGSIHLNHGGTEMGQGLFIKVAQVVANALAVPLEQVKITATSTAKVPNTSATAASSGADLNAMAALNAARTLKRRLSAFAAQRFGVDESQIRFSDSTVHAGDTTLSFAQLVEFAYLARVQLSATGFYRTPKIHYNRKTAKGRPFYYFAYGAAVSEVAIDSLTGESRVTAVDILHDAGRSLNPAIDLGQVEGGFIQGMGWLTNEELWWDDAGHLKTHAPSTYKIPTCSDRPGRMDIRLWSRGENSQATIHRSKAVGEPPLMLAISVHQALSDALSSINGYSTVPALDTPATAEALLFAVQAERRQASTTGAGARS